MSLQEREPARRTTPPEKKREWVLRALSIFSAFLCLCTVLLWLRSYWRWDTVRIATLISTADERTEEINVNSCQGAVLISSWVLPPGMRAVRRFRWTNTDIPIDPTPDDPPPDWVYRPGGFRRVDPDSGFSVLGLGFHTQRDEVAAAIVGMDQLRWAVHTPYACILIFTSILPSCWVFRRIR